jgi:hypothetical protein
MMFISCLGGLSRSAEAASPSLAEDEALLTTSSTLTKTMESQQSLEDQYDLLPSPIIKYKETAKKDSTGYIFTQWLNTFSPFLFLLFLIVTPNTMNSFSTSSVVIELSQVTLAQYADHSIYFWYTCLQCMEFKKWV